MSATVRYLFTALAVLAVSTCLPGGPLSAEEPPEGQPVFEAPPPEDQPVPETALAEEPSDAAEADDRVREQSIYIPYEELRNVFEKHGRGVFLPYEQFRELWEAAREQTRPPAEERPPVAALIAEIDNEATVAEDVVEVKARLTIEVLAEGWNEIPLRLADAAITAATLGDQPARIVGDPRQGYRLLLEKKGTEPEQIELQLEYAKAITRAPGRNSVSLQSPQAAVSRWQVRIPQPGVKVDVHPLIAAAEVPGPADGGTGGEPQETVVQAFVGAAPTVRIDWTPKAEGALGLGALSSVQAEQQVWVGEGVTRTRTRLDYAVSRAELAELKIEVPGNQKVVNVFDPNVRQWSVEAVDDRQQIAVDLFEPAENSQQVTIELEQFSADGPAGVLQVPVVKALGADRQQGVLVVQVAEGLRATAGPTMGLLQIDAAELPGSLATAKWHFAYRYATGEYALELQIEKVRPRVTADSLVEAYLEPERLSVDMAVIYTVQRAGVFQFELEIPPGFDVREVRGRAVPGVQAAEVDSHDLTGPDQTRLVVNLARQAAAASREPGGYDGRVGLVVRLRKELEESTLLNPGGTQQVPLPIPQVAPDSVEQADGRLVVYAPESLRVSPGETEGMRSVSFGEARGVMAAALDQRPDGLRAVLAFTFAQQPDAEGLRTLQLAAERRRPQVTIRQLLVMRIDSGVVKYEATLFYDVRYSGVESLWIDVPPEVSAGLRNETKTIQEEKVAEPPPAYAAEGDAWKFTAETELLGEGQIKLVWEEQIDELGIGKSVDLEVPYLRPIGVDRAWGQIVLAKAETIDVEEKQLPAALQPIDPQHDLIAPVAGAARAMEFHDDWALTVTATQYELKEVKRTSIEQGVVRMVVTRADQISVQALYRIRSARQRLQVQLPPNVQFDTEPARINGRAVSLQGGDAADSYLVPLIDSSAERAFVLELRYMVPGNAEQLDLPEFPEEPAVQKVYLCAYLPEEWSLLGSVGPWTKEYRWWLDPSWTWKPRPRVSPERLIARLGEDVELAADPAGSFPTDGQVHVFSTLRPAGRPDGSLQMRVMDKIFLDGIVFVLVVAGGLLLLPACSSRRALAIGALIVALVLCGVFLPTFALQVLDGVLASAIFIVLVVWVVWYFVRTRPVEVARRRAALAAARPASPAAEGTPSASQPPTPPAPAGEGEPPGDQSGPQSQEGGQTDG